MNARRRRQPAERLWIGFLAIGVFIAVLWAASVSRQQRRLLQVALAPQGPAPAVVDSIAPYGEPVVTYDRGDRQLEVLGQHLPADTLVCIRFHDGQRACGLLFQWMASSPKPLWPGK